VLEHVEDANTTSMSARSSSSRSLSSSSFGVSQTGRCATAFFIRHLLSCGGSQSYDHRFWQFHARKRHLAATAVNRLKVKAFGPAAELLTAEDALRGALVEWESLVRFDGYDLELFRAPPDLLEHTLVLTETVEAEASEPLGAAGCAPSCEAAVRACVGELVERSYARGWDAPGSRLAAATDLAAAGEDVFPLEDYLGRPLHPARWPCSPFDPRSPLRWVSSEDLVSGSRVWVPHSLVVLGPTAAEDSLAEVTTVGMAAALALDDATDHALLELVERDVLMRHWLRSEPLEPIAPAACPPHLAAALERDASLGWETALLTAQSELGPEVAVVLTRNESRRLYSIGASAHAESVARVSHAFAEALQLRLKASFETASEAPPLTFDDRLLLYAHDAGLALLHRRLVGSEGHGASGRESVGPAEVLRRLHERGGRAVRVTLAEAGAVVVRVLATRLQAMEANEACARITAPELASAETEYLPHPFA
jgi:thiazole/oxazole-forming peptide maturase SagD family component